MRVKYDVPYPADMRERAADEDLSLATISIGGAGDNRGGATIRLYVRTEAQRKAIEELIERILLGDLKAPKS